MATPVFFIVVEREFCPLTATHIARAKIKIRFLMIFILIIMNVSGSEWLRNMYDANFVRFIEIYKFLGPNQVVCTVKQTE